MEKGEEGFCTSMLGDLNETLLLNVSSWFTLYIEQ